MVPGFCGLVTQASAHAYYSPTHPLLYEQKVVFFPLVKPNALYNAADVNKLDLARGCRRVRFAIVADTA